MVNKLQDKLSLLRERFKDNLTIKKKNMDQLLSSLSTGDRNALPELLNEIHKLSGSSGTFGYPELSLDMKKIEADLKNNSQTGLTDKFISELRKSLDDAINRALSPKVP